ncbi:alpha/beta fold hydrolase [Actinacidiphila acididurans]|uniref:Alpha/beta hydrolase n=1 Tax=Actinacidiphila acididurans TaxID=2784346 RepID=A0ABS2U4J9_9ACTN|nr:alpha/beta hydrolase [Actinacidiphila acididurans]MBM9510531.1 alpha/beta hydrolase [Actinacidiphila acididurans]
MSRTPLKPGRPAYRALSALALLTLTAGALTACDSKESSSRHAPASPSATSSAAPRGGPSAGSKPRMITHDGHRLAFYVTPGSGRTIVLDSGGGEDASYWKDLVPKLHAATGATVITYDRAGMGKSDVVPGAWNAEGTAGDLTSGLEQLGVTGNVILVSHSEAGEVANYFAAENPKMLSGAVLVDSNLPQFFTDEEIARVVAGSRSQIDVAKRDPGKPGNRQLISTAEDYLPAHQAFHKVSWPDSVPVTVIVSEKTPFDGSPVDAQRWRDAAASFVKAGPHRTLVTAKGSSHDVPKDRPALVLKEIEAMAGAAAPN